MRPAITALTLAALTLVLGCSKQQSASNVDPSEAFTVTVQNDAARRVTIVTSWDGNPPRAIGPVEPGAEATFTVVWFDLPLRLGVDSGARDPSYTTTLNVDAEDTVRMTVDASFRHVTNIERN